MTTGDRIKHTAEEVGGKIEQAAGKVTGNDDLEARGRAEEASARAEKMEDETDRAVRDVLDR